MRKILFVLLLMGCFLAAQGQQADSLAKPVIENEKGKFYFNLDILSLLFPDDFQLGNTFPYPIFNPKLRFGLRYGLTKNTSIESNFTLWNGDLGFGKNEFKYPYGPTHPEWGFYQFRGVTKGYGGELKFYLKLRNTSGLFFGNKTCRTYYGVDFQRGKGNDVTWVSIRGYDRFYEFKVDIVSTRIAVKMGIEEQVRNYGKTGKLCFSLGGGLIFHARQVYAKQQTLVYQTSPANQIPREYHDKVSKLSIFPHLDFGLKFYYKAF